MIDNKEKIYSKAGHLLHVLIYGSREQIKNKRHDFSPDEEFLQVACMSYDAGVSFRPHLHIENNRQTTITQESWVIVRGSVKVFLYDENKTLIKEQILQSGDCSVSFRGGHAYEILEENTLVYEFKTGPYEGQKKDKEFI